MEEQDRAFHRDYSTAYPLRVRSKPSYPSELTAVLVKVTAEDGTVGEILRGLADEYPATQDQLLSVEGELNRYVKVKLTARALKTVSKNGAYKTLKKAGLL